MHLQLIALFYDIRYKKDPGKLFVKIEVPENIPMESLRSPPAIFKYEAPRTHAWDAFFTNSGERSSITDFDLTRLEKLKA